MLSWPGLGGLLVLGFCLGLGVGAILAAEAVWTSRRTKRAPLDRAPARAPTSPRFRIIASLSVGVVLGFLADAAVLLYVEVTSERQGREVAEMSARPLSGAACARDVQRVEAILREPLEKPDQIYLGQIAFECASARDGDGARDAVFAALMPPLHRLYLAGQHFPSGDPHHRDYCQTLETLVAGVQIDRLRQLSSLGLPLHCGDGLGKPGMVLDPAKATDQLYALIGQPGRFLAQMSGSGGSYLDRALSHGRAMDIEAALRAGIDPHRTPLGGSAPVLAWALRKHVECEGCRTHAAPAQRVLTQQDIARVDLWMPAPSATEIDRCDPANSPYPALMNVKELANHIDGGVAYLQAALRQGADIGVAACWSHDLPRPGIFGFYQPSVMAPAMLATLRALDDAQFRRLAHPGDRVSGNAGIPLLTSATRNGNRALVDLVCERLPVECPAQPVRPKP